MGDRFGPEIGARYREAFGRSSFDGMLNYYRANYGQAGGAGVEMPNLPMPVLQFHGLKDTAVDKDGLKNTWDWIDADYTLVTIPDLGALGAVGGRRAGVVDDEGVAAGAELNALRPRGDHALPAQTLD